MKSLDKNGITYMWKQIKKAFYTKQEIGMQLSEKINKNIVIDKTLEVGSWSGDATPYSCGVTIEGISSSSNIEVRPAYSMTLEQINAFSVMELRAGKGEGILAIQAVEKPVIDIPIRIVIRDR